MVLIFNALCWDFQISMIERAYLKTSKVMLSQKILGREIDLKMP